jgi:hypothetical protein
VWTVSRESNYEGSVALPSQLWWQSSRQEDEVGCAAIVDGPTWAERGPSEQLRDQV